MIDDFNFDDSYKPPTKQFIRNSLTHGLLLESTDISVFRSSQNSLYSKSDMEYMSKNRGKGARRLIRFAYENKEKIKSIPILGNLALSGKRRIMNNLSSNANSYLPSLDLSGIMELGEDNFIRELYIRTLGRVPDVEGMNSARHALYTGLPKEALVYAVCTSEEFANRAQVVHLDQYRKIYSRYQLRERIKRLPVIRRIWALITLPRKIDSLSLQIESLHALIKVDLEKKISAVDLANQNIINANVKLDETATLIIKMADRNRPFVYGLPGGVTAVQTKEYIIGVPSEEWRLAVFLSIHGRFEFGTEDYFRSIVKKGMNVLDIGANLGIYTLHALSAGCQVFSYEPTPEVYKILLDNIGINGFDPTGRANVFNLAVSDTEGEVEFAVYNNQNGHNSFFASSIDDKKIKVKTVCLDHHLAYIDHIDVAKIDVEGAEPLVLRGMKEIVAKNPSLKIIMEFAPSHLKRGGNDPQDFVEEIHAMGFDIHLIDETSGEICEISDEDLCAVYSANVLLAKSS